MDRLHSMRVFARVIELGSFAAAARELAISPAAVTRLIADLEEHLGARLIHRTTRRLALTDTGELYLERVRVILAEVDDAETLATTAVPQPRGLLRIACPAGFAVHQLARHLPRFRALYPRIGLELVVGGAGSAVDDAADLSLVTDPSPPPDNATVHRLARIETVACASPDYLDRRGRPLHPRDLAGHDLLVAGGIREQSWRTGSDVAPDDSDAPPDAAYTVGPLRTPLAVGHAETQLAAALAGLGIATLPSYLVERSLLDNGLERVLSAWTLSTATLAAVVPARRHLPARARVFIDFLGKAFGGTEHDPWLIAAGCETRGADRQTAAQHVLAFTP